MVVDPHLGGARVDQFLAHRIGRLSRTRAATIVSRGDVRRADGTALRPSSRVVPLEQLTLWRIPPDADPPDTPLNFIHEDDDLLVLDKPPSMTVHPSARYYATTLTQLLFRRGYPPSAAPDAVRVPHPVHRLDRETSGVLLCARSGRAERTWKQRFSGGRVHKTYLALCSGAPPWDAAVLDWPLGLLQGLAVRIKMGPHPQGLPSVTDVDVLWRGNGRCLLRCRPRTGRTHQIRAHLSAAGLPILGDKLYGPQGDAWFAQYADHGLTPELASALAHPRQALHAAMLAAEDAAFVAPWPDDLCALEPDAVSTARAALATVSLPMVLRPRTWVAVAPKG